MQVGRLPLRKSGIKVLEVGAGPAPALYAARDFYAMLRQWPGREDIEVGRIATAHSLERGQAWDPLLHHVSEHLMLERGGAPEVEGLPFSRSIHDFIDFDVTARHHESVAARARSIADSFDAAGEYLSQRAAMRIAYSERVAEPSAYDLIFMCNFLTQPAMTDLFRSELQRLCGALSPGGVLVVMGGTGSQYPEIYQLVRTIAGAAHLKDISPSAPLDPNLWPYADLVCEHERLNVRVALDECDAEVEKAICAGLPRDLWNSGVRFSLPKYQVLAFVLQRPPTKRKPRSSKSHVGAM